MSDREVREAVPASYEPMARLVDRADPNWPLPSFDARDWAAAFRETAVRLGYSDMDEGWLVTWFSGALMRGYDEGRARAEREVAQVLKAARSG
jgi:hypothetical protein